MDKTDYPALHLILQLLQLGLAAYLWYQGYLWLQQHAGKLVDKLAPYRFWQRLSLECRQRLRLVLPISCKVTWILLLWQCCQVSLRPFITLLSFFMALALFYYLELQRELERRRRLLLSLPHVLDLLALAMLSGQTLPKAMLRVSQLPGTGILGESLAHVMRQTQAGVEFKQALRDLAQALQIADIRLALDALIMSYSSGGAIAATLGQLALRFTQERLRRAELAANRTPMLLLAPLFICIFPASFVVLFLPIIHRLTGMS